MSQIGQWAALTVLAGIQVLWFLGPHPPILLIFHVVFLIAAVTRPTLALIAFAAIGPLTTSLAEIGGSPIPGSRHLEAMALAVIAGAVVRWRPGPPTRTAIPALLFGGVCVASAVAVYPTRFLQMAAEQPTVQALFSLAGTNFVRSPFGDPLFFAVLAIEGAALAWVAESLCRRTAALTTRVVSAAVIAHAIVASLNVQRLVSAAGRRDDFSASFWEMFRTVRVSTQYDLNAAGSVFLLMALASVGLWTWRRAFWQIPATGTILTGLWLTGSRVALAAAATLALVTSGVTALRSGRGRNWRGLAGAAIVIAVAATVVALYPSERNLNVSASVESRGVLFRTGLRMVRDSPAFGVGIGRFHELSEQFGSADIARILGVPRTHENAHNNFLQVAAELGVVGALAFGWVLSACLIGGLRQLQQLNAQHRWLLAGLLGMMLTWMTGHPLLVPEAALMFWLFAGLSATLGQEPVRPPRARVAAAIVLVAIAVSIPWQAAAQRRRANLEHLGRGLSAWHTADTGERYREAGREFSLFLPAGHLVTLPMRTAPGVPAPLTLQVLAADTVVDRVVAGPGDWVMYVFRVPNGPPSFIEVKFSVEPAAGIRCDRCLLVGRQIVRTAPPV